MKRMNCKLDGKSLTVRAFSVEYEDGMLSLRMECVTDGGDAYLAIFQNASLISMVKVSYPFQICGFEIIDKQEDGYQKENRYFVNDYENGTVSFYCESFEIYEAF